MSIQSMLSGFVLLILLIQATMVVTNSSTMYGSAIIKKSRIPPAVTQPSDQKLYSSLEKCSFACQLDQPGYKCEAFSISPTDACFFGEVEDCTLVIKEKTTSDIANTTTAWYDKTKFGRKKVIEMHTAPGSSSQPKDLFNETKCTELLTMPTPVGGNFNSVGGHAEFKGGTIVCSGHGTKRCQYWIPGMTSWKTTNDMNHLHIDSAAVALGWGEVMIVGNRVGASKSEILGKTGDWVEIADYPEETRYICLIAKSSRVVYGIGGEEAIETANNPRKSIFRYNRQVNSWTRMDDMPVAQGGSDPNCIKVLFRGRDVILCFGATFEDGKMLAFDLETEKWEDTGRTAPTPPYLGSVLFVTGNLLYRYRGITRHSANPAEHFQPVNTVDYFNLEDETWSTQTRVAGSYTSHFHRHVFTTEVLYKLA